MLADQIQILTSAVMGLTVACARCHDHKYDPISQRDYYRLSAVLQAAYDPYDWLPPKERKIDIALESEKKETAAFNAPLKKEMERLEQSLEAQAKPFREKLLEERLASLPEAVRQDLRNLVKTPQDKRSEVQKYLAEKFKTTLEITDKGLIKKYEAFKTIAQPIRKEIEEMEEKLRPEPHVRVLSDMGGEPSTSYLLRRGEVLNPGPSVEPGVPEVLTAGSSALQGGSSLAGGQLQRQALGIGPVAHTVEPPADLKGHGESDMDAPLWPWAGADCVELRALRYASLPPRALGLVGH